MLKKFKENVGDSKNRYRLSDAEATRLGLGLNKSGRYRLNRKKVKELESILSQPKMLVYDIETSRGVFKAWWTGKQYLGHHQLIKEPAIISIAWKWVGFDEVYTLTWDKNHCDKKMVEKFMKVYNSADVVVGQNNDRFDNRWVVARAIKWDLEVNNFVRSFDIMKQMKRIARIPSYSMKFITQFKGLIDKQSHEGIYMWDMVEDGTVEEQKEYLQKMVDYNIGDIIATEDMFLKLRPYFGSVTHLGVALGKLRHTCPHCGGSNVEYYGTSITTAGTRQIVMRCKDDGVQYKVSTKIYEDFLKG